MSDLFDVSDDYEILDGNAAASYFVAQSPASPSGGIGWTYGAGVSIANANLGEVVHAEAAPSAGVYGRHDARIRIPAPLLTAASITPKLGDQVTAGGFTWTVLHAGQSRFGDHWRLDCRELVLANGLRDSIDIKTPVRAGDGAGSDLITWHTFRSSVPARIQIIGGAPADLHNGTLRGFAKQYMIWVAIDLDLPYNTLIVNAADGTLHEMIGFANRQRIDELSQILTVIKPGA